MTEFEKSRWAEPGFSNNYVESADIAIVERTRSHAILQSFFRNHFGGKGPVALLDLGCGDGILTYKLMQTGQPISATLVDGSDEMLRKAAQRLHEYDGVRLVKASFQEIIGGDVIVGDFDFIVSSLAIHHLDMKGKRDLFGWIFSSLKDGCCFLNIDVILAPDEYLEKWYLTLWQEWIAEKKALAGITGDLYDDTMKRYKDNKDNKPDTLDAQLAALSDTGFKNVDCYFKYGIFSMYGGRK